MTPLEAAADALANNPRYAGPLATEDAAEVIRAYLDALDPLRIAQVAYAEIPAYGDDDVTPHVLAAIRP